MRGQGAPSPAYGGEDGVIARLLGGPHAVYTVTLPAPGEPKRAILETDTKGHPVGCEAPALIDVPRRSNHPDEPSLGARAEIALVDGTTISDEVSVADTLPARARSFARGQYIAKFGTLSDGVIARNIQNQFLAAVTRLPDLGADSLASLALPDFATVAELPKTWGVF